VVTHVCSPGFRKRAGKSVVPAGHAEKALWGKMRDEKPPEKKPLPLVAITQSDFRFMLSPILARRGVCTWRQIVPLRRQLTPLSKKVHF